MKGSGTKYGIYTIDSNFHMGGPHVLTNIESFDKAFHERSQDLSYIKNNRRIATMHLGGVVIECLIKMIVVKYYNISQRDGIHKWVATQNFPTGNNIIRNPSHKFNHGLQLVAPLYNRIDANVLGFLNILQQPAGIDFIDLRYHCGTISDQIFKEWTKAYIAIRGWLIKNLKTL